MPTFLSSTATSRSFIVQRLLRRTESCLCKSRHQSRHVKSRRALPTYRRMWLSYLPWMLTDQKYIWTYRVWRVKAQLIYHCLYSFLPERAEYSVNKPICTGRSTNHQGSTSAYLVSTNVCSQLKMLDVDRFRQRRKFMPSEWQCT